MDVDQTEQKEQYRAVRRPGLGTMGRQISLSSNFYPVEPVKDLGEVQQFDVTIQSGERNSKQDKMPPPLLRRVLQAVEQQYSNEVNGCKFAYDGRDLAFANIGLDFSDKQFQLTLDEKDEFFVTLKRTRAVKVGDLVDHIASGGQTDLPDDARNALQIILSTTPKAMYKAIGSSFYQPENPVDLGRGCEAWRGFHHALRVCQGGLSMNIDISYSPFYMSKPVDEMAGLILGWRGGAPREGMTDNERIQLERELRGLKVLTTHRPGKRGAEKKLRIIGLTRLPSDREMFTMEREGGVREISVAQYFEEVYRPLRYPQLPCVCVERMGKGPVKGPPRKQNIPMEVLTVCPGQRRTKSLRDTMVSEMIKTCNVKPVQRMDQVRHSREVASYETDEIARAFGIEVAGKPLTVTARVLDPPMLHFNLNSSENQEAPASGTWNMRSKMVYFSGQTLVAWGVLVLVGERQLDNTGVQRAVSDLLRACEEKGITVENKKPPIKREPYAKDVVGAMTDLKNTVEASSNGHPCQLVFVIKEVDNALYRDIKTASDSALGFPSQCALAKNLSKGPQYFGNVSLKVNSKLGGKNWVLSADDLRIGDDNAPFMVLGSCVTKPATRSFGTAVATVIGSLDPQLGKHASTFTNQDIKDPYIIEIRSMVASVLRKFRQEWDGRLPQKLLFYRDGASEGAFSLIISNEIADIKAACNDVEPGYKPKLTFVVTSKRHHARFCPGQGDAERSGNCRPGTVIDTGVCHARDWDFYLFSHSGIQGTSRPTKYTVLLDENGFTADSLQRATYNMCFTYARCSRSVSYVPVAYYASLYGLRIQHIQGGEDDASEWQSSFSGGQRSNPEDDKPKSLRGVHENLETVMFYM